MTSLKTIVQTEKARLTPPESELRVVKKLAMQLVKEITLSVKQNKVKAVPFIGGSFARGTLLKKEHYEVDVFLRFDPKEERNLSDTTETIVKKTCTRLGWTYTRVHGSRDYFKIVPAHEPLLFEIIPVVAIKKPSQERNITDLSYFHVKYIKSHLKNLGGDVLLAKQFCQSQGVYGAESYIQGFSGYGLECLVIHYKGFIPFLKAFSKIKEQLILDPSKHYRNPREISIVLNESKRQGPVVLIDPTYKERNALAALNEEQFQHFRKMATQFLKKPSTRYFEKRIVSAEKLAERARSKDAEFLTIRIETNRPSGDIAGTKLKKFSHHLIHKLSSSYKVFENEFVYAGNQEALLYIVAKPLEEVTRTGPYIKMKSHAETFKKEHPTAYVKSGRLYAKERVSLSVKTFVKELLNDKKLLEQMSIVGSGLN